MNQVNLIGRITKEPELRTTQLKTNIVTFTLAVNRYKDENGESVADFITCVAWKNQADFIAKYVKKGNLLAITGRIQTRSYDESNGAKRTVTEVIAENVENLTPKEDSVGTQKGFGKNDYQKLGYLPF